jgi:MFS family permease
MIICNTIVIVAICFQLIELRFTYLLAGRLLLGFVIGIMSSILPLYLNSIAPLSISGKIGSMNQVLTCFGVITAYTLGFIITEDKADEIRWRILVGFPILPCLLSIVSLLWIFPYDRLERHIERGER